MSEDISGIHPQATSSAVSVYAQEDALDDFPVLKAFQQYIDAEQIKARKRMLMLCVFFGCLMISVISVFVVLLYSVSNKNQALNDRLIEYAMNRDRVAASGSQVVVQPPQDSAAILALTAKLDALQKKLADDQAKAEKAAADAAARAEKAARESSLPKPPTAAELEVKRLKALLASEKEKNSAEQERQRQADIEAYRRKHYPELYEAETRKSLPKNRTARPSDETDDGEIDALIEDIKARTYFEEEEELPSKKVTNNQTSPSEPKVTGEKGDSSPSRGNADEKTYSIPVEVKGSSMSWTIPKE